MNTINVIQIVGIVALIVASVFTYRNYELVKKWRWNVMVKEVHAERLRDAALKSLSRSQKIQEEMRSVAAMTPVEVTRRLKEELDRDPERFYRGLGVPDAEGLAMNVSGSYEYGVIIGALWMARLVENGIADVRCPRKRISINGVEVGDVLYDGTEMTGVK